MISLETLKVKLAARDILLVFNHLDSAKKGHIDYNDFCNLSDERRMNLDPASAMLQEYNKTGKGQTKSPSRKAK